MASSRSSAAWARQLISDGGARIDDEVAAGTGRELERSFGPTTTFSKLLPITPAPRCPSSPRFFSASLAAAAVLTFSLLA